MNDLEDLKDAMHTTPDFEPRPLDLDTVMAQGGRLRRRRQFAVGATSGVAVLALLVGGAQVARLGGGSGDGGGTPASAPFAAGAPSQAPSTAPSAPPSVEPADPRDAEPLGEVIETGLRTSAGEHVLWFTPVTSQEIPDTTFGLMMGRRTADGELVPEVIINETEGSDRAPGFHSPQGPMNVNGVDVPAFGYYAGAEATKITVRAGNRVVEAGTAVWSEDPAILAFWFDPDKVTPDTRLSKLTAYDKNGDVLPGAGAGFGVG